MAKIMLVEDDTNLSEIYQARLTAEGYEIVSAHDGEEALALAAKEKPDLIVSDVMMPKISGFEMLDILRNTEGLKETKVIMLTALGQADDKTRADSLGADRYLVKSQVTLEDIVKATQELLTGTTVPTTTPNTVPDPVAPAPAPTPMAVAAPPVAVTPAPAAPAPVAVPPVAPVPVAAPAPTPALVTTPPAAPAIPNPIDAPAPQPAPEAPAPAPVAAPVITSVPAPTPVSAPPVAVPDPAPAPPTNPTVAADNQLVADAIEGLMEGVADRPAAMPAAAAPAPQPAPEAPAPADVSADSAGDESKDSSGGSNKKIIKPITDDVNAPKPSLESLLADEERKNLSATGATTATDVPAAKASVTEVPHQPGHIITPSAAENLNNGVGIDPNSIAL